MEKATKPVRTVFHRLNKEKSVADDAYVHDEHLRPLPVCSRMITCGDSLDVNNSKNLSYPFCDFKIEIVNNLTASKRKLDDSCLDDSYETPANKRVCLPIVSPDLACFLDSYDILPNVALVSPLTNQEGAAAVSSPLYMERVQSGPPGPEGRSGVAAAHAVRPGTESLKPQNVMLNLGNAFDNEIDNILCLSPISTDTDSDECIDTLKKSCQEPTSKPSQRVTGQTPAQEQVVEEGCGKEEARGELQRKGDGDNENDAGEVEWIKNDEGYFSRHYLEALEAGKDPSQAVTPLVPQTTSSPLVNRTALQDEEEEDAAPCPRDFKSQPVTPEDYIIISSTDDDCPLTLKDVPMMSLEANGEVSWNFGPPIFESSVCHSTIDEPSADASKEDAGEEEAAHPLQAVTLEREEDTVETSYETTLPFKVQVKSLVVVPTRHAATIKPTVSPKLPVSNPSPSDHISKTKSAEASADASKEDTGEEEAAHPLQAVTLEREEDTVETSYETTLPLKVQVKSLVVVPTRHAATIKPTVSLKPPVSNPSLSDHVSKTKSAEATKTQRPVVFDTAEDWRHARRLHVDLVYRHMKENTGVGIADVMTELLNLMTHVHPQGSVDADRQLQHPSDFTRRNYQRRFGNTRPRISLDEWQSQNNRKYQRFAQVPEVFERSPSS